jgi:hypothetical protein
MKQRSRVLILISVSSLVRPAFLSPAAGADCFLDCMQRSGCWSGRSVTDPAACNNMPQLCQIQCQGKANNAWGAIAYSRKEQVSGWSYEQDDKATAERVALQQCAKQGGGRCLVEASFNHSCDAVAADGEIVTWGTSDTKSSAQQRALAECGRAGGKKCAVEAAVCSLAGASTAPPSAPPPPKGVSWGAIAYSSKDMGAGWSQRKAERASAEKEAMDACSKRGKACVLRPAFNKQCGALAADRDFTGFATSADQREALRKAIDECKQAGGTACVPHIAFCSM